MRWVVIYIQLLGVVGFTAAPFVIGQPWAFLIWLLVPVPAALAWDVYKSC